MKGIPMSELTGFEGPECKACESRNTVRSIIGVEGERITECADCGLDFYEYKDGRKWVHSESMLRVIENWEPWAL
jgi:hypothetical protein